MKLTDIFAAPVPETRIPLPYVIAEAGVNHEGSMDIARRLIDEAARGRRRRHKIPDLQGCQPGFQGFPGLLGHEQGTHQKPVRAFQKARRVLEKRIRGPQKALRRGGHRLSLHAL